MPSSWRLSRLALLVSIGIPTATGIAYAGDKSKIHGPSVNSPQYRQPDKATQNFCNAAENRNIQMMGLFLQQGADINNENCGYDANTPLMRSLYGFNYSMQVAEYIFNNGADVNYQTKNGETALMMLVRNNFRDDLNTLLPELFDHGAKVDLENNLGNTALDYAVSTGYDQYSMKNSLNTVRYLVKKGADVNHKNKSGTTPLMLSSKGCGVEEVKLLLSLGANPKLATPMGETAMSMAADSAANQSSYGSCNEVVRILQNPEQYSSEDSSESASTSSIPSAPNAPSGNPLENLNNALMKLNKALSGN